MSDTNGEKGLKRSVSLKAVCAVALAAFVLGAVVASAVFGNPADQEESAKTAENVENVETAEAIERSDVVKDGDGDADGTGQMAEEEERQLFQEYLDGYLSEHKGTVDLREQEKVFDWYQTYPIYRMADGHMAWTNVSGVCASGICDFDGDGAEELILFELNGERLMGMGELSIHIFEVVDGRVRRETSYPQNLPSDAGGSELTWSLLPADGAVYVLYRHQYYGVSGGAAVIKEAVLYRYQAGDFCELFRIDEEQERALFEKRLGEAVDEYGIHPDGEEVLFTFPMWVVSQGDFHPHDDRIDGQGERMAAYQRFLNGEGCVRIREGVWEGYDGEGTAEWTMQDLLRRVCDYYLDEHGENEERIPYIEYAWIDCGGDGAKELAVRFVGVGMESTEDLTVIIACHGAVPEVVYARHSWSRSSNDLLYHGCISHYGSSGAMDNYGGMDYVDGSGDLQTVYTVHALGHQGGALRDLESYEDSIASVYAFTDITYGIGDTEYVVLDFSDDISEEIRRDYIESLEEKGRNVITQEEADGLIEQRAAQLGIRKEWMAGENVLWSYCYW